MATIAQRMQLGPFFDQGQICGAALLEHYAAGTSTAQNIWADAGMTTALAQPFVSDANGMFNFFGAGTYKIIVKKADGTLLHTLDNWSILDSGSSSSSALTIGPAISTASSMTLGDATTAHWVGSTNVATISGTALFYWAIADGNFSLLHSSSLLLPDSRNRKVNASDILLFLRESTGVYRLAAHMEKEGGWKGRQAAGVAASATLSVPADGDFIQVSGGTTITAVAVASPGVRFQAMFTGTGLNITHNGTSLIAPFARDYRTVPNEIIEFRSLGSGNWVFFSLNGPPDRVGTIISSGDPTGTPPGFLPCDGAAVSRATFSGLWSLVGGIFGAGDGSTTFNVPDERGRTEIMVDGSAGRVTSASTGGANADTLGGTGGAETHTLTLSETPSNSVNYTAVRNVAGGVCAAGGDKGEQTNSLNVGGSNGAHSNTQPWIAVNKYIRF